MPFVLILSKKRSCANQQTETMAMEKRAQRICTIAPGPILPERAASFQLCNRKKSDAGSCLSASLITAQKASTTSMSGKVTPQPKL
jgi:hypothetical protein